jgi:hypothetical protein
VAEEVLEEPGATPPTSAARTPMSTTAKIITAVSLIAIASTLLILLLWLLGSFGEGSESALTAL